jgi:benzoyl-CoA reductase/2-hydroxyglutaryl-CoA dehydratase subunit BcrC/BadD/HgdB
MLKEYFSQLETGLKKKLEQKITARRKFIYEIARIGNRMFNPEWSTAWTTVFVPFEILTAMNISGMFIEFIGAMLSGAGVCRPYLEEAEAAGFSTDSCAYHRTILGTVVKEVLPEPDVLVAASFPCNGGVKALRRIGDYYHKNVFIINMPYDYNPESIDYLVKQYEQLIDFLTEQTGRKLNEATLRQSIKYNNEAREYLVEALNLCKNVPSPANSDDLKNFIMYVMLYGTEEGVEVAKTYRDDFKERINQGIAGVPDEKYRLLWIQNRIQFKNNLVEMLEQKYKANLVIDELNHVWWDPMDEGDPLRSLALRNATHPLLGPVERRIKLLVQMARDFRVNGAINPSHWGCRQSGGARTLFKEALQEINVPVINLDVDCVDDRNFSEAQLLTRLEAFIEML